MTLKQLVAVLVAAVVVGLLGWLVRVPPPAVHVAIAAEAPMSVRVTTNGVVEPVTPPEVRAGLAGRVLFVAEPGAAVEAGDRLLEFAAEPVIAALASARSERLSAQESLAAARRELARARRKADTDAGLFARGGTTEDRYRETVADLEAARAHAAYLEEEVPHRIASLDARIGELAAQREAAVVTASQPGTVYEVLAKAGETAKLGQVVLRFADLEELRLRANVDQVDLGAVSNGQGVTIRSNAYPGRTYAARVSEVIPRVVRKEARLVAEALAAIEPPSDGLIPGMTVDVEIVVAADAPALQIPADALFTDARGAFVMALDGDVLREARVTVGRSTPRFVEIRSGLESGTRVVRGPLGGLSDGERVSVRSDDG